MHCERISFILWKIPEWLNSGGFRSQFIEHVRKHVRQMSYGYGLVGEVSRPVPSTHALAFPPDMAYLSVLDMLQ